VSSRGRRSQVIVDVQAVAWLPGQQLAYNLSTSPSRYYGSSECDWSATICRTHLKTVCSSSTRRDAKEVSSGAVIFPTPDYVIVRTRTSGAHKRYTHAPFLLLPAHCNYIAKGAQVMSSVWAPPIKLAFHTKSPLNGQCS
jgi:hypothetical protein